MKNVKKPFDIGSMQILDASFFVDSKSHRVSYSRYLKYFLNAFIISFHFKMIMSWDKQSVMNDQHLVNTRIFTLFKYFFIKTYKL